MAQKKHNMLQLTLDLMRYFRKFYADALEDYEIDGGLDSIEDVGEDLILTFHEMGKQTRARIAHFNDYTSEQIMNIWEDGLWDEIPYMEVEA